MSAITLLRFSVGSGGVNDAADVRLIKTLLNRIPPERGGPVQKLAETPMADAALMAAITRFQAAQFGWADGRVEPDKATLAALNRPGLDISAPWELSAADRRERSVPYAAMLNSVSGKVEVRQSGGGWEPARAGMVLYPCSNLSTGDDGRASLTFVRDGTRVELAPRSLMVIYGNRHVVSDPGSVAMNPDEIKRGLAALHRPGSSVLVRE